MSTTPPDTSLRRFLRSLGDADTRRGQVSADSPDVTAAKRLLDTAKDAGFVFVRIAPGEDGPLRGIRETVNWVDEIYLAGFGDSCSAVRRRR